MEIVKCPNCGKPYHFSKEQLSKSNKIVFPCLGCKTPIIYELPLNWRDEDTQPKKKSLRKNATRIRAKSKEPKLKTGGKLKKKIFRALDNLPPMSQVVYKALEIMTDPNTGIEDIANVIETDQSMVSNILRISNSAYYGPKIRVSSIDRACVVLGKHTLREIIIMAGVSNLMQTTLNGYGFSSGELWAHSIASALGSKIIAEKRSPYRQNDAYIAGLIHDVGKIILDQYILDRISAFETFMKDGKQTYFAAEKNILGFDHAEIASEICIKWNFPKYIAHAIRYHHHPSFSKENELSYIVHMADFIARSCSPGFSTDDTMNQLEEGTMDYLSLNQKDISGIMSKLAESMEHFEFLMN